MVAHPDSHLLADADAADAGLPQEVVHGAVVSAGAAGTSLTSCAALSTTTIAGAGRTAVGSASTSARAAGASAAVRLVDAAIAVVVFAVVADLVAGLGVTAEGGFAARRALDLSIETALAALEGAGVADDVLGVGRAVVGEVAGGAGSVSGPEAEVVRGERSVPTSDEDSDDERRCRPPPRPSILGHEVLLAVARVGG